MRRQPNSVIGITPQLLGGGKTYGLGDGGHVSLLSCRILNRYYGIYHSFIPRNVISAKKKRERRSFAVSNPFL